MRLVQMMSYRRWKNTLAGHSHAHSTFKKTRSCGPGASSTRTLTMEKFPNKNCQKERVPMFQAHRPENEQKNKKEIKMMEKEYKKTVIFRKERVAEIKKRIQNKQYHVSGAAVVDKWFPEQSGK